MSSLLDDIQSLALSEVQKAGVRVHLKTDISPSIKIYDSDDPNSVESNSLIKYGVRVTTRAGKEIASYGGEPKTNYFKLAAVGFVIASGLFITLKGLKGSYEQIKS